MKKLAALLLAFALSGPAFAGQGRMIDWKSVAEVRAAFEDAFKTHLTPAASEQDQAEMEKVGAEHYGEPVLYLGFSLDRGPVFARKLTKSLAEPVCASLGLKVGSVDEEKQILVCDALESKSS